MLNRLLKYEIKATARKFLPLYAAIIVVSLFVNWGIRFPKLGIISGLSNFLLAALFVSLIAITLITIIQRFKNNLLSNEGYLMFTLPVSTKKLILSKLICAVVWAFLSVIVSVFSFLIIAFSLGLITSIKDFLTQYSYYVELIKKDHIILATLGVVSIVMQFVYLSFWFTAPCPYLSCPSSINTGAPHLFSIYYNIGSGKCFGAGYN